MSIISKVINCLPSVLRNFSHSLFQSLLSSSRPSPPLSPALGTKGKQ